MILTHMVGYDSLIEFTVCYQGSEVLNVSLKGYTCREVYNDKKKLNEIHSNILKRLKLWKMNKDKKEIETDFTQGEDTNADL